MKILMYCLLALNVGVWLMYGIDKWKAKSGRWRIPEKVLLLAAFAGGSVGALAGMMMFRHKTKKAKFVISVPIFFRNSSSIQMYRKHKTCLHIFASGHLYVLSAFL